MMEKQVSTYRRTTDSIASCLLYPKSIMCETTKRGWCKHTEWQGIYTSYTCPAIRKTFWWVQPFQSSSCQLVPIPTLKQKTVRQLAQSQHTLATRKAWRFCTMLELYRTQNIPQLFTCIPMTTNHTDHIILTSIHKDKIALSQDYLSHCIYNSKYLQDFNWQPQWSVSNNAAKYYDYETSTRWHKTEQLLGGFPCLLYCYWPIFEVVSWGDIVVVMS